MKNAMNLNLMKLVTFKIAAIYFEDRIELV